MIGKMITVKNLNGKILPLLVESYDSIKSVKE
jgi:hypothetical protein